MCDLESMFKVQFLKWAKKYYEENDSSWKFTLRSLFQGINLDILLKSNYAEKHIPKCSSFYRAMFLILNGVRHVPSSANDIYNEQIWYNKNVTIDNNIVYDKKLLEAGIRYIYDACDADGNIFSFDQLTENLQSASNTLFWNSLRSAIPKTWKKMLKNEKVLTCNNINIPITLRKEKKDLLKVNKNKVYMELVNNFMDVSRANVHYSVTYQINLEEWKIIYSIPHNVKAINKVKEVQYKILHRYIATNYMLYKMGKVASHRCEICFLYAQTVEHLFFHCTVVQNLWLTLSKKLTEVTSHNCSLTEKDILFGKYDIEQNEKANFMNLIILNGKYYIYDMKIKEQDMTYTGLVSFLHQTCNGRYNYII